MTSYLWGGHRPRGDTWRPRWVSQDAKGPAKGLKVFRKKQTSIKSKSRKVRAMNMAQWCFEMRRYEKEVTSNCFAWSCLELLFTTPMSVGRFGGVAGPQVQNQPPFLGLEAIASTARVALTRLGSPLSWHRSTRSFSSNARHVVRS